MIYGRKRRYNVERHADDPYALRSEYIQEPPVGFWNTVKFLGPGLILVGSVVGSGEIILTTTLGATVGFVMLWWMLLSCWGKSIVQAELGRYAVSSGSTALSAFNDIPGKFPFSAAKCLGLFCYGSCNRFPVLWVVVEFMEARDRR